jgi:hypothetical protein
MKPPKDPQIVTSSVFRDGEDGDYLVFSIRLVILELKVVAKIPFKDEKRAPVYINFKLAPPGTSVVQTPDGAYPAPRPENAAVRSVG